MIAAVASLIDVEGVMVGEVDRTSGEEAIIEIQHAVARMGIEDRIVVYQNVSFGEMRRFFESADVFVLVASSEPAAISVLEALACGAPAMWSDSCGTNIIAGRAERIHMFVSGNLDDLVLSVPKSIELRTHLHRLKDGTKESQATFSKSAFLEHFDRAVGHGSRVLVLGAAYKKNMNDSRETPAAEILNCVVLVTDRDDFDYDLIAAHAPLIIVSRGRFCPRPANVIAA